MFLNNPISKIFRNKNKIEYMIGKLYLLKISILKL